MKKEAEFQTEFGKWSTSAEAGSVVGGAAAFELKICAWGKALPFSAVKEHQIEGLRRARGSSAKAGALYYKLSDLVPGFKPFDCFVLRRCGGWVVVQWWKPGVDWFYLIDVEDYMEEKMESGRRSLTEERAAEIGMRCSLR